MTTNLTSSTNTLHTSHIGSLSDRAPVFATANPETVTARKQDYSAHSWYVGALNAYTTNRQEAEKMGKLYPLVELYHQEVVIALETDIQRLMHEVERLVTLNDALRANEQRLLSMMEQPVER